MIHDIILSLQQAMVTLNRFYSTNHKDGLTFFFTHMELTDVGWLGSR